MYSGARARNALQQGNQSLTIKMSELEFPDICNDPKLVSPRPSKYDGAIGTEQDVARNFLGVDLQGPG